MRHSKFTRQCGTASMMLALLAAATAASAEPVAIDDLARLPVISNVTISDDGKHMVALVATGEDSERPSLSVWNLDDPDAKPVLAQSAGDAEFVAAAALKAGRVYAFARNPYSGETFGCIEGTTGATRTYLFKSFLTDTSLKDFDDVFGAPANMRGRGEATERCFALASLGGIQLGLLPLDPEHVVISELDVNSFRTEFSKYNLKTGRKTYLFTDQSSDSASFIDPRDATVWARTRTNPKDGMYEILTSLRNAETGEYETHSALTWNTKNRFTVNIVGRDEATGKFYVVTDQFSDKTAVYFYDPKAAAFEPEPLFALQDFSATGVVLGRTEADFNRLLGFTYDGPSSEVYWVDEQLAQIQESLDQVYAGRQVTIGDFSADRSKVIVTVSGSDYPARYFLLRDGAQLTPIGDSMPWLSGKKFSRTRFVSYTARDGLKIPALLTLPVDWKPGDPPAPSVVMPHGGPWARDYIGWDDSGWPQYFTTRGFAVLQPQYRGSQGLGLELWRKGDAKWGLTMQDDKDDGVKWMVEQGYADPNKAIIMGYSYGGFAAFAATVREGGPFRCAIAGAGVSDVKRLGNNWSENRLQRLLQGFTVAGMNPIENADKAKMPLLIFHGDRDVRVPISHSRAFYNKVKDKAPTTFVEIEDMPHQYPWRPTWKKAALEAMDEFLAGPCKL